MVKASRKIWVRDVKEGAIMGQHFEDEGLMKREDEDETKKRKG